MSVEQFPIEKEYEKNPDISPQDISKLREWLKTQPHLPGDYISDLDLLITYHCCDRSSEVSKQVLDLHYTLRTLFTVFFKDRQLDNKIHLCLDSILFAALPQPTVQGYRAVYCRLLNPDPRCFLFNETIRTFMMFFDLWQREEGTWPGFVIMIDMDTAVLSHVTKLDIMSIRQVLYFLQECMLIKLKAVHFLNAPHFMDKLMALLRPFMKRSLLDMIHVHQPGSPALHDQVPRSAFPEEVGGEFHSYATIRDDLIKRLKANEQFFKEENKRRVDESLRPGGKTTTVETLFGIQGSFKKLDID